jgi:hypothetical protein
MDTVITPARDILTLQIPAFYFMDNTVENKRVVDIIGSQLRDKLPTYDGDKMTVTRVSNCDSRTLHIG